MRRVVLLGFCACGRIAFEPSGATRDAVDAPRLLVDAPRFSFDAGQCPPGYSFVGTSCYRAAAMTATSDWLSDELACEANAVGAHLVVIVDNAELDTVRTLISTEPTWIGTSKRSGGYKAVTGVSPYLALGVQTEPSEDCLSLHFDSKMYLHTCGDKSAYVCEYDGVSADPSSY